MKDLKPYVLPLSLAALQWLLTTLLRADRVFFTYDHVTPWMIATKVLYFLFLAVAWCFLFAVVRNVRGGNKLWQRGLQVFAVYFPITLVFLLLLWPGTWSWDDIFTLERISTYESWDPWQHILTGAYDTVLLNVLPFPGGLIFLQNILVSVCVAFVVPKLESTFHLRRIPFWPADTLVKVLPFLLPPVLTYQFSGYRLGMYIYVELVALVMLLCAWKDKKEWSWKYTFLFTLLAVDTCLWRTESLVYVPFILLLLLCTRKDVLPKAKKVVSMALVVVCFVGIYGFQSKLIGNDSYQVMSLMRPTAVLVRAADDKADAEDLAAIDKVVSVEAIRAKDDLNGEQLFWEDDVLREGFTADEYSAMSGAMVNLAKKYPKVVLTERWELFVKGSGWDADTVRCLPYSMEAYRPGSDIDSALILQNHQWPGNTPISREVRERTIHFLGLRKMNGTLKQKSNKLLWNAFIPEAVLLAAWLLCLALRKWWPFGLLSAVLLKLPVVFLTEPARWFMYQLSFYLLGFTVLVYGVYVLAGWYIAKRAAKQTDNKETVNNE